MLNQVLGWMGVANSATHFAQDALNVVKMANIATNLAESEQKKKEARIQFIENLINVGVPLGVGVGVGVAGSYGGPILGIFAAQAAQSFVKSSGIGRLVGSLIDPIISPIASLFGFIKHKVRQKTGLHVAKWVDRGVGVVEPVVNMGVGLSDLTQRAVPIIHQFKTKPSITTFQKDAIKTTPLSAFSFR